ncbi:multiple epidermal growth factor-like domains protein 6 [Nematostella vectensis]|uniref:multiple epidermal growth factor-like domains protein 6 n=1 Tax=Nematostella vectensis TaxID=45351 RepID=UPI0020777FFC|nr:multiple epidermal growth factor-like domains protein 6 [Nematostella vectensis]XP_048589010.1 multiple epidermal growth factor-like domains protein 6 [Nematostella vectensis]
MSCIGPMSRADLVLLCVLASVYTSYSLDFVEKNGLKLNGSNVCREDISRTSTSFQRKKVVIYYYTRICEWFGICYLKSIPVTKEVTVPDIKYEWGEKLYCCTGWAKRSEEDGDCLKPICTMDCDHGQCVGPDRCECDNGWTGYICERDVNECYQDNGKCEQGCINTYGSFHCGCWRGYKVNPSNASKCLDVDECAKTPSPCRCVQEHPQCKAMCINTIGSYKCACHPGFRLTSQNECIDLDECLSGFTNKCAQECINTVGAYKCACFKGYQGTTDDNIECQDVDECQNNNGGCEQNCVNIPGSYRCNCNLGFTLHFNGRNCTAES